MDELHERFLLKAYELLPKKTHHFYLSHVGNAIDIMPHDAYALALEWSKAGALEIDPHNSDRAVFTDGGRARALKIRQDREDAEERKRIEREKEADRKQLERDRILAREQRSWDLKVVIFSALGGMVLGIIGTLFTMYLGKRCGGTDSFLCTETSLA
jgi:hypothetical protein